MATHAHTPHFTAAPHKLHLPSFVMPLAVLMVFIGMVGYAFHAGYQSYSETYYLATKAPAFTQ